MLVSAIMPTADRRHLLPLAIACFAAQDWPEKELIVIDDGKDCVADLFAGIAGVTYLTLCGHRLSIGAKLNIAIRHAAGDILIRWDDDDWSASNRITDQVTRLLESGKSISGYHSILFWDVARQQASRYAGAPNYSLGTAVCFMRAYWAEKHFPPSSQGEDNAFLRRAQQKHSIASIDAGKLMVARIHPANTAGGKPAQWPPVETSEIPAEFFADLQRQTSV